MFRYVLRSMLLRSTIAATLIVGLCSLAAAQYGGGGSPAVQVNVQGPQMPYISTPQMPYVQAPQIPSVGGVYVQQPQIHIEERMMTLLGAQEQQIESVSFGKEKPRAQGHDESSWAENRRDDVLYSGE